MNYEDKIKCNYTDCDFTTSSKIDLKNHKKKVHAY